MINLIMLARSFIKIFLFVGVLCCLPMQVYSSDIIAVKSLVDSLNIHSHREEVFFATNRNQINNNDSSVDYGEKRGGLRFGSCQVDIHYQRDLAALAKMLPFQLDLKLISLKESAEETRTTFFKRLETNPAEKILLFIHGYNYGFKKGCRTAAQLKFELRFNGPVILFSWPSDANILNYTRDEADMTWSVPFVREFLHDLANVNQGGISIIAHSMGGRALFDALSTSANIADRKPKFDQIILTAPDIDADTFRHYAQSFLSSAKRTTLYASAYDAALTLSRKVHGYPRLGDAGEDLLVIAHMDTIDVSHLSASEITGHRYYRYDPQVIEDMHELITKGMLPAKRKNLSPKQKQGLIYWEMKKDPSRPATMESQENSISL